MTTVKYPPSNSSSTEQNRASQTSSSMMNSPSTNTIDHEKHPQHEIPIPETADYELESPPLPLSWYDTRKWPLYRLRLWLREYVAEFFGTAILLIFGDGVVATTTFNVAGAGSAYLAISFGWGIGLAMALYVCMGLSGGHLNPAVTLANAVFGKFPWRKVPGYMFAQVFGGFVGAACMYGIFRDQFDMYDGGDHQLMGPKGTGGIFCTYAKPGNGKFFSAFSEILNTGILLMIICGLGDDRMTPAVNFLPIAVGLLVFAIGCCSGWVTGYAINPARDFGPRIFSTILYGKKPFTWDGHYFWVPTFMPLIGGICGIFFYEFFILPDEIPKEKSNVE